MIPPPDETEAKLELLPAPEPLDGFAPKEFKARRDALRAACPDGLVLIRGSTEDEVVPGSAVRFRQNSSFFYLTGVDTPGAFLVLLPEGLSARSGLRGLTAEVKEILFLPPRDAAAEVWSGPKLGPDEATEKATGIAKSVEVGRLWGALSAWIFRNPVVYTLSPFGENARGTREYSMMRRIADAAPVVQFRDASPAVARLRVVKSAAEVDRLRQAIAITAEGHRAAAKVIASIRPGDLESLREYDVEAEVLRAFRAHGAIASFATIVGAGVNGTTLHYDQNAAPLGIGAGVVVDAGARFGHYCGDITRTYPVGGIFTPKLREVYSLVLAAHEYAVREFKLGEDTLDTLNDRCKAFLKESPLRSHDATGQERTMDAFMPHGLGHYLGLEVHDVGDRERPLEPGSVFTIEPGVYLPSEAVGVRLEDDYVVTPQGLERLGPPLDKSIEAVEAAMR